MQLNASSSTLVQKIGKILRAVLEKKPKNITQTNGRTEGRRNTIFRHLIPYNPRSRIFFKNPFNQFLDFIILDSPANIR